MMVVNFTLYLRALGWHASAIGLLLTASGLAGALLSLGVGYFSDRYGRKRFILTYEALTVTAGILAAVTWNPYVLSAASIVASFGRGQSGGAGPFGPAEQAWITRAVPAHGRSRLFSLNAAIGFVGMGVGALVAGSVVLLHHWLPGAAAFRPLFLLPALGSAINLVLITPLKETPDEKPAAATRLEEARQQAEEAAIVRHENREMAKLALTNALNGLAVGMTGPLIAYWFAARYGVSPADIGGLMSASFFATGLSNLLTGRLAERVGVVRTVAGIRLLGVASLVAMTLMGSFAWAAVFYFLRSMLNRGSVGARQAVSLSLTRDKRRGLAASLNVVSMRVPASVGPTLTGYLMDDGNLTLPFFLGAGLQTAYALVYARLFARYNDTLGPGRQASDVPSMGSRQAGA
jgi:MFS family permease